MIEDVLAPQQMTTFYIRSDDYQSAMECFEETLTKSTEGFRVDVLIHDRLDEKGSLERRTFFLDSRTNGVVAQGRFYPQLIDGLPSQIATFKIADSGNPFKQMMQDAVRTCVVPVAEEFDLEP